MAVLGDRTKFIARVSRAKSNALKMSFADEAGTEFATARQKGGAGVLFGFKNGGKGQYTLTAGDDVITLAVASTTTITRGDLTIGRIVPSDGAAHIEDGNNNVLIRIKGYDGPKHDATWRMPLTDAAGAPLGTLALVRRSEGFADLGSWLVLQVWLDINVNQPAPTQGAMLELDAPVPDHVGDILAAACVDACMLGRGYLAAAATTDG